MCGLAVPTRSYPARPAQPCLASTIMSGCVRSCLDLHRACSALSGAALFHPALYCLVRPFQPCLTLFCSTLSDAARPGHARPCLALLCSILSGAALSGPTQPCLALPYSTLAGAAWPGPVRHCPVHLYPILPVPGSVRPVRSFLALFGTV